MTALLFDFRKQTVKAEMRWLKAVLSARTSSAWFDKQEQLTARKAS